MERRQDKDAVIEIRLRNREKLAEVIQDGVGFLSNDAVVHQLAPDARCRLVHRIGVNEYRIFFGLQFAPVFEQAQRLFSGARRCPSCRW